MLASGVNWELLNRYPTALTPATLVGVVIAVCVSCWLIFRLKARFREDSGRTDDKLELLAQFRELRQQGELTEDEYRLIKSRLAREAVSGTAVTPNGKTASANAASAPVRKEGDTESAGESGQDGVDLEISRSLGERPNESSTT